jgi:hypothetical protein
MKILKKNEYFERIDVFLSAKTDSELEQFLIQNIDSAVKYRVIQILKKRNNEREKEYIKVKDFTMQVFTGKSEIRRLNRKEERARIAGGRTNVEASIILGRKIGTSEGDESTSGTGIAQKQEKILEDWAKLESENGNPIWFDYDEDLVNKYKFIDKGSEAEVFFNGSYVLKSISYNASAYNSDSTPMDFLDNRIALHNHVFPDTKYELLGFTKKKGVFQFILSQPFIKKGSDLTQNEIDEELKKEFDMNILDSGRRNFFNDDYLLNDIHLKNAIRDADGNIFFIDTQLALRTKKDGGKRQYTNLKIVKLKDLKIVK